MNKKLNVLLADHTPAHTHGIRNLLNHYNDYVTINHVKDGWDIVTESHLADLVILYNNIPSPNGIELLVSIKMKYPKAKVMLFIRDPEPYYRNMCELLGVGYFFQRSTVMSALPEAVKELILGYQIAA
jgi:DNA-binding NarL/FixJ family response regulator